MSPSSHSGPTAREALLERVVSFLAEQGSRRASLADIAQGLDTTEEALRQKFGSRLELMGAIIPVMGAAERAFMEALVGFTPEDELAGAWEMWDHTAIAQGTVFAPMYFEVAAEAMYGTDWAVPLRAEMRDQWSGFLTTALRQRGLDERTAGRIGRLVMAVTRGLVFDLAMGADRAECDEAMQDLIAYIRQLLQAAKGAKPGS